MKTLKHSRGASFIIVSIVYLLATLIGIVVYKKLNLSWYISLLVADVISTIVTFVFSLIFQNSSVYDPYWSVQPLVILICFAINKELTVFNILLIGVVGFWAIRLTANWAYTFTNLTQQDWRYTMLKEKTKGLYPIINFIGIHLVPTLIVYGCILPGVYAIKEGLSGNIFSVLFLLVSFVATIMQGVADIQMHKFRKNRTSQFNRNGLWKYSRHPNYLGEILMWWGIGAAVVCADFKAWYILAGAVANTILFLVVSIPMADKRQARKEGFDIYKKQTRMLLPIKKHS